MLLEIEVPGSRVGEVFARSWAVLGSWTALGAHFLEEMSRKLRFLTEAATPPSGARRGPLEAERGRRFPPHFYHGARRSLDVSGRAHFPEEV